MKVSFEGIGESVVTFLNNEANGAKAGDTVKVSGSGEVRACADGDRFAGVSLWSDKDAAAVQVQGFVTMPYTGTAPALGFSRLACSGGGYVKSVTGTSGGEYLVLEVDTSAKTVGFIL